MVIDTVENKGALLCVAVVSEAPLPGKTGLGVGLLDDLGVFRHMNWPEGSDV